MENETRTPPFTGGVLFGFCHASVRSRHRGGLPDRTEEYYDQDDRAATGAVKGHQSISMR
jgi:hypothetical protein